MYYQSVKDAVIYHLQGICRMVETPGAEAEAAKHNESIDKLFRLFQDKDPIDDEIVQTEKKLAELKQKKNENIAKNPYGYTS